MNTSLLFVGSYAEPSDPGIWAFRFDAEHNSLVPQGSVAGIHNPTFLVAHPHHPWLIVASEHGDGPGGEGSIRTLRYDTDTVAFSDINGQPSGGAGPCHVRLDSSGRWVVASNYGSGSVAVLPLGDDGMLGPMTAQQQHSGSSADADRQEGPHAHSAIFTPDERWLIVADLGIDQLVIYAFDSDHGTLTPHGHGATQPGAGPRHMIFHPSGTILYAANELDNTVAIFDYDSANGTLVARGAVSTLPPNAPTVSYVADIHITAAGTHLLVSNRGHNSIAVFEIGGDGALSLVATPSCGGDWPRNFAISPTDRAVLVANQNSGTVAVLPMGDDGHIASPAAQVTVPGACCIEWVGGA